MDHEFATIVGASRELSAALRSIIDSPDRVYRSSVHHHIGKLWSVIDFWITRDPRIDANVSYDEAAAAMFSCYVGRDSLRSAMIGLWVIFRDGIKPRIRDAWQSYTVPQFEAAELAAFDAAIELLARETMPANHHVAITGGAGHLEIQSPSKNGNSGKFSEDPTNLDRDAWASTEAEDLSKPWPKIAKMSRTKYGKRGFKTAKAVAVAVSRYRQAEGIAPLQKRTPGRPRKQGSTRKQPK
ncbi:MAG: hypothetical protein WD894_05015 [Pirellulales bacterium]